MVYGRLVWVGRQHAYVTATTPSHTGHYDVMVGQCVTLALACSVRHEEQDSLSPLPAAELGADLVHKANRQKVA